MQIDDTLLNRLETLSHLRIDPAKREEVIGQLGDILTYIENLNELDTDHLSPAFSTLEGGTPLRDDTPYPTQEVIEKIIAHASEASDNFFVVPAIIE